MFDPTLSQHLFHQVDSQSQSTTAVGSLLAEQPQPTEAFNFSPDLFPDQSTTAFLQTMLERSNDLTPQLNIVQAPQFYSSSQSSSLEELDVMESRFLFHYPPSSLDANEKPTPTVDHSSSHGTDHHLIPPFGSIETKTTAPALSSHASSTSDTSKNEEEIEFQTYLNYAKISALMKIPQKRDRGGFKEDSASDESKILIAKRKQLVEFYDLLLKKIFPTSDHQFEEASNVSFEETTARKLEELFVGTALLNYVILNFFFSPQEDEFMKDEQKFLQGLKNYFISIFKPDTKINSGEQGILETSNLPSENLSRLLTYYSQSELNSKVIVPGRKYGSSREISLSMADYLEAKISFSLLETYYRNENEKKFKMFFTTEEGFFKFLLKIWKKRVQRKGKSWKVSFDKNTQPMGFLPWENDNFPNTRTKKIRLILMGDGTSDSQKKDRFSSS
ncbi:hypothetical protein O181_028672 [Austropuccinia psidii MF-1]|uniref:Uncharacterized protein n=1 Tax=Austropuccinia psidii MF-1 TaxID=1389203 RepID=A0A9Q3CV22_9BASI|nr:hypothetical protein [Austropuccinia psidii MF-1]